MVLLTHVMSYVELECNYPERIMASKLDANNAQLCQKILFDINGP